MFDRSGYRCLNHIRRESDIDPIRRKKFNIARIHKSILKCAFNVYFFDEIREVDETIVIESEVIAYPGAIGMQHEIRKFHLRVGYIRLCTKVLKVQSAFFFECKTLY